MPNFGAFGGRGGEISSDSVSVEGGTEEGFSREVGERLNFYM